MYRLSSIALLVSLAACSHTVQGTGESLKARADGSGQNDGDSNNPDKQNPDTPTSTDAAANVTANDGGDSGGNTCNPSSCEANGYTCGSFTDCDGKVRTCGACSSDKYCSADSGGSCKTYSQLCQGQTLTLLGTCVLQDSPFQDPRPGPCAALYGLYQYTEYRDNVTALPALTLKSQCEQKDVPSTFKCSDNTAVPTHTWVWIAPGEPNPYANSGMHGCLTGEYDNGCHDTRRYSTGVTAASCAQENGTLLNP